MQARAGSPFCCVLSALGPPCLTANVNPLIFAVFALIIADYEGIFAVYGSRNGVYDLIFGDPALIFPVYALMFGVYEGIFAVYEGRFGVYALIPGAPEGIFGVFGLTDGVFEPNVRFRQEMSDFDRSFLLFRRPALG